LRFARQRPLAVDYKGLRVDCGYRLDIVVDERILVELKTVERLLPIHEAQVVTYLRLARLPLGLLVNFNVIVLKTALRRLTPHESLPQRRRVREGDRRTGRSEDRKGWQQQNPGLLEV